MPPHRMRLLSSVLHIGALVSAAMCAACSATVTAAPPNPIATLKFARPVSANPDRADATLAFLAEDKIALRYCSPFDWQDRATRRCWLEVVALVSGKLDVTAETETIEKPTWTHGVFAVADGSILVTSGTVQYLYSADLKERREVPIANLHAPAPRGNVAGANGPGPPDRQDRWTLYRLSPILLPIREGRGLLYDVSDDYVMYVADGAVRVETLEGKLVGIHNLNKGEYYVPEFIGPDRLYLRGTRHAVADFNGRELLALQVPGGYGSRERHSADGTRMLFDYFVQTKKLWQQQPGEGPVVPIPNGADGEMIWVVETTNAGICFEWNSLDHLLGMVGRVHADLSPSGRLLAAVTTTGLSVYEIPETCTANK